MTNQFSDHPGWVIARSIALELDIALSFLGGAMLANERQPDFADLIAAVPTEWMDDLNSHLQIGFQQADVLETFAWLTDTLLETDYAAATLPMRGLTLDALAHKMNMQITAGEDAAAFQFRLIEEVANLYLSFYTDIGIHFQPEAEQRQRRRVEKAMQILADDSLKNWFWHWMDRFYYQVYQTWRTLREGVTANLEQTALTVLRQTGEIVDLTWLPAQNPLVRLPELKSAVEAGKLRVVFWAEPFGITDSWLVLPGLVMVSFAEPGVIFENFSSFAGQLAERLQALADPTRLIILRLIRSIGMTNTDMAEYLGLARPTVSIHARLLREAGLIESRPEGRITRHAIKPDAVRQLFSDLERFLDLPRA